jgi:cytochrome d ubiquinol oxidase subunit II
MIFWLAPVPLVTAVIAVGLLRTLAQRREWPPFLLALGLFLLGAIGLGASMWPYVVPQSVTIWQAAAPERSQVFMLIGVGLVMPLILAYTGWAYWVFRGKVGTHGYH